MHPSILIKTFSSPGRALVLLTLWLLLTLPGQVFGQSCSAYQGQVKINELRVGASSKSNIANQVELFNNGNVAESVWRTWQLVVYYRNSAGTVSKKGGYLLSTTTQYKAVGPFIYNNNKAIFLANRKNFASDVALVDASGAFIDYVALGGQIQTLPACLGTAKVATLSAASATTGTLARATDGGNWPAAITNTTVHTIGFSNVCSPGVSDLSVTQAVDTTTPMLNSTTVSYSVAVTNKSCTASVSGIVVDIANIAASKFSGLSYSGGQGSKTQGVTSLTWAIGTLAAGASTTLVITGKPIVLGDTTTTASVVAPASGLANTGDDSAVQTISVSDFNYVSFDLSTDTVTEGTDTSYSASISIDQKPTRTVTVSYTVSGSAGSGDTNLPVSGSVTIDPNSADNPAATSITFTITNDAVYEATKTIVLTITGVSSTDPNVKLDTGQNTLTLTLVDDDPDPTDTSLPTPTAEYLFDEAAWSGVSGEVKDSSGNAYHATAAGLSSTKPTTASTSRVVNGDTGTCAYGVFNRGNKDYVALPAGFPDLGSSHFTITAWIRTTNNALSGQRIFVDDETGVGGFGLSLGDPGAGMLRFYQRGAGSNVIVDTANVIASNTWYFVAVVVETKLKTRKIYVYNTAGTLLASPSSSYSAATFGSDSGAASAGGETNAAAGENSSNFGFAGNIDELRVYPAALTPAKLGSVRALTRSCAGYGPDHYELSMPSTGLACTTATVTVTACASSASPCTSVYTAAAGGTATLSASAGTLGAGTVTFNAAGVATTTFAHPTASNGASVAVTLSGESTAATGARQCCPDGVACAAANSCSMTVNSAGFMITSAANGSATATIGPQVAGTASGTYTLRAIQTNTTTKACEAALTGATTVNWALQCNNPGTCAASNLMTVTGSSATAVSGNSSTSVSSYTAVPMSFDANGNAPFSLNYADVGQVRLWVGKTVNGAPLAGSTNSFVTKPASLALSSIRQTASPNLANPAAATAAGSKFVKAGEAFSATVSALTSGGAATPNFGRESTAKTVLLTPTLVLPAGGVNGSLSNGTVAGASFSGGTATVSTLAYSEVGIISLTPSLSDGDYLGAGAVAGTASGNIGRFVPSHFALTTGSVTPGCSGAFTYFGQDGFSTAHTLTAQSRANATTQNYTGSFAKLGLTAWANHGFAASGLPAGSALSSGAAVPAGSWTAGNALITATHQVSRPSAATAQTGVVITTAPVDSDGVALAGATAVAASTPLRYGRLRLSNAFGSASAALQVPVVADHWSGNAWVLNSADSCTTVPAGSVALSNPRSANGNTSTATSSAGAITLAGGNGLLTLAAPTPAGSSLSLDIALNLGSTGTDQSCQTSHPGTTGAGKPWLRSQNGSCASTADRDPAARASFGIHSPETRKTVHARELF